MALRFEVPEALLVQHLAASPAVVGEELARQVDALIRREGLGYYPALAYFQRQGGIDAELLSAVHDIAWFAGEWVRGEVRRRLRGVFSTVTVESLQCQAFNLPAVRPRQPRALETLARHYTPTGMRLNLIVTMLHKVAEAQGLEKLAARQVLRILKEEFRAVEVVDARLV